MVGEMVGAVVGSEVVGEIDGDVVGSEVVGEIDGEKVGGPVGWQSPCCTPSIVMHTQASMLAAVNVHPPVTAVRFENAVPEDVRCMCTTPAWNATISTPEFSQTHQSSPKTSSSFLPVPTGLLARRGGLPTDTDDA